MATASDFLDAPETTDAPSAASFLDTPDDHTAPSASSFLDAPDPEEEKRKEIISITGSVLDAATGPGSIAYGNDLMRVDAPPEQPMVTPTPTFLGELGAGLKDYRVEGTVQHLGKAGSIAYEALRRPLSPLLGPTESQRIEESIPFGKDAKGNPVFEYKPLGDRPTREAGLLTSFLPMQPLVPSTGDSKTKAAAKALFNTAEGLVGSVLSPGGIITAGSSAGARALESAGGIAGTLAGAALPETAATAIPTSGIPTIERAIAGGFAADMAAHVPEQLKQAFTGETTQQKIEGALGALTGLAFGYLGAKHAAGTPEIPIEQLKEYTRTELEKLHPDGKTIPAEYQTIPAQTLDGLHLAKEKLKQGFDEQPKEEQANRQELIDSIDDQLLRASREDVNASVERVRERAQSTPPKEAPASPVSPEGPPAEGGRSDTFAQARREAGITDEAQPIQPEQRQAEAAPKSQQPGETGAPAQGSVPSGIDDATYAEFYKRAERISEQVAGGRSTAVREAARDAALKSGLDSASKGQDPIYMRRSAQAAAGEELKKQGESLDATPVEGKSLAETIPAEQRVTNEELYKPLNDVLGSAISERDASIVRAVQERSMEDVAAEHGITKQRVSQIVRESLPKLRKALEERGITQDDYVGGPGAMGPVEALEMKMREEFTGTKNARVEAERILRGEEPLLKEEPISNIESIAKAKETLAQDPARADVLVEQLNTTNRDVRTISTADEAILMAHKVDLMNQRRAQEEIYQDGTKSPEEHAVAAQKLTEIEQKMNAVDQATYASGAEWGRMGQLRQRLLRADYSLEAMERKARIQKGEALTPEERVKIKEQATKIKELQDKLDEVQKANIEKGATKAIDETVSALKKEAEASSSPESKFSPKVIALAESIVSRLDKAADSARQRIRDRLKNANAAIDPTVIYDVAVIGLSKLARASMDFAKWAAEMRADPDLGQWVEPHLQEAWKETNRLWKEEEKKLTPPDRPKVNQVRANKGDVAGQQKQIDGTLKERAAAGDAPADVQSLVQRLALNFVRGGITERNALIDAVHGVLEPVFKGVTKEQTRDLISGYGEFKQLDKEAAKVALRGLKGEMQQVSKIEEMQRGQAPRKTGIERREPNAEERRLIKEVNELKKRGGFQITDPATQLKSALDAIKTRLNNEIRDLDTALATRERLPSKKNVIEYDAETKALKEQRDAKRAQYDELFPKEPLTQEQMIDRTGKALDRSISQLESDIKSGRLYGEKSRRLTSPELDAKRARLDALRDERQTLRDLDTATIESKKEANLVKAIEDAQKAIPDPKEKAPTVETERISQLEAELESARNARKAARDADTIRREEQREKRLEKAIEDAKKTPQAKSKEATADTERVAELKRALQEARDARASSPESQQRKMDAAIEAVRKSIAEYDRRLREGDTSPRNQKGPMRSDELDTLRNERDVLERAYREMVKAKKPVKSADEIALQAYKTRTKNRIAELQDRIAKQDFEPKPKKPEFKLDKEALDLKGKIQGVKDEFNEGLVKYRLGKRSTTQKIIGSGAEVLNTARAILTSLDLSAVLRQGGFIALGNPIRAAKAMPDMFRAFVSEAAQRRSNEQIKARPNYDLYEKAKLYLSDTKTPSLSQMEEAYMSRWAKKIPLVAGSERAYTTFLNRLRADTFDALTNSLGGKNGITLDEAKTIANFVNVATGRGSIGKAAQAATGLNTIFFSPRYVASRFQLMAEPLAAMRFGEGATARTRTAIAKEYGKFLAGAATVYALGMAAGATVETDPKSSDFGKLKFGNTRVDPLGGILQNTTLLTRMLTGQKKTTSGEVRSLRPKEGEKRKFGDETTADVMFRFARSKFSPILGSIFDLASGQNVIGQQVTPAQVAKNSVIPMSLKDVADTMKEQGIPEGTIFTILSLFGMGVQTYDSKKPTR